jgi:hypothetical protein
LHGIGGSDALLVTIRSLCADDAGLEQIEFSSALHLALEQLELADLTLGLAPTAGLRWRCATSVTRRRIRAIEFAPGAAEVNARYGGGLRGSLHQHRRRHRAALLVSSFPLSRRKLRATHPRARRRRPTGGSPARVSRRVSSFRGLPPLAPMPDCLDFGWRTRVADYQGPATRSPADRFTLHSREGELRWRVFRGANAVDRAAASRVPCAVMRNATAGGGG